MGGVSAPPAGAGLPGARTEGWYADWQNREHAVHFDGRARLSDLRLKIHLEAFNDVRLLGEWLRQKDAAPRASAQRAPDPVRLLEIGCATGEFYRYLRSRFPKVEYRGMDISEPALARAREKYPQGNFYRCREELTVEQNLREVAPDWEPEVLYSKDVLHHQTDPYGFLGQLLSVPSEALVIRTRTRDKGATVLDPDFSCQYHYQGWMPYIVLNLEELLGKIRAAVPSAEIVALRHPMVLGGRENRFLPKECYLPRTGTAESAVGVFLKSSRPGTVTVENRADLNPAYPLWERVAARCKRMLRAGR